MDGVYEWQNVAWFWRSEDYTGCAVLDILKFHEKSYRDQTLTK